MRVSSCSRSIQGGWRSRHEAIHLDEDEHWENETSAAAQAVMHDHIERFGKRSAFCLFPAGWMRGQPSQGVLESWPFKPATQGISVMGHGDHTFSLLEERASDGASGASERASGASERASASGALQHRETVHNSSISDLKGG